MSTGEQFEFGACQLDMAQRLLLVAGRPQPVAPKVLALLCHLIAHRDRVVSKDEIIESVWHGAEVSETALARTVMKARQAIADTGAQAALITTVHGVGYRFSGLVRATSRSGSAATSVPRLLRVGLLPLANSTGDASFDWAAQGLPTLVGQALDADQRIALVSSFVIAGAWAALPPQLTNPQRMAALAGLLGTRCLVQAVLRQVGGRLRLEYHSFGDFDLRGRLQGADVPALGLRLANAIEAGLFPSGQWPLEFISRNPLANEAFARAVEVGQQEEWHASDRLLRTVLEIEPGSMTARLQHLRVLANLQDPAAVVLGNALLEAARTADDDRLLAMVHEALGRALFNIGGERQTSLSMHHLDEAMRLAAGHEGEDWVIRVHIGQAVQAHVSRDYPRAMALYGRALRGCERSGNLMRRAAILNNRARAESCCGNLLVARELAEESLAICNEHRLHANAIDALSNLALIDAGLGLFRRARRECEQAIAGLAALPENEDGSAAWVLYIAGDLQLECRASGLLASALAQRPRVGSPPAPRVDAVAHAVEAHQWLDGNEPEKAHAALRRAVMAAMENGHLEDAHDFASALLWLLLRARDHVAAAALLDDTQRWPSWDRDHALQAAASYARAARHHADGEVQQASQCLAAAVQRAPPGRWHARAALDSAWLALERGDVEAAQPLLRGLGSRLEEHPAGIAVQARLHFAQGRATRAAAVQQDGLDVTDPNANAYLFALCGLYASGSAGAVTALPTAPRLASLI